MLPLQGASVLSLLKELRCTQCGQKKKIILFACLPHPLLSVSFVRAETFPQHLGQCLAQNKWPVNVCKVDALSIQTFSKYMLSLERPVHLLLDITSNI